MQAERVLDLGLYTDLHGASGVSQTHGNESLD